MSDFESLKTELFQEITDKKYKCGVLVNVFLKDSAYVKQMVKEGKCSQVTLDFLENNIQKLTDISNQVSIPFFRNVKYEELLQEYCAKKSKQKVKVDKSSKQVKAQKQFGEIALDTKEWLLDHWGTDTYVIVNYLINETKSEKIVWVESKSGNAFTIVIDDTHIVKLKRSIKKRDISFLLVRKNDGKNQSRVISKEEFERLYAAIKKKDYHEELKSEEVLEKNDLPKSDTVVEIPEELNQLDNNSDIKPIRQTNSHTKGWLLLNWTTIPRLFINYLIDETRAGNVVWSENLSGNAYSVVWDTKRTIQVEGFIRNYYLVRSNIGKKKKRVSITQNDFERLRAAIKNEAYEDDEKLEPVEKNEYKEDYVIENIDSFIQLVVNETNAGNIVWNEFIDGKTFTAKIGSNNVITLIRSKKKRKFMCQVITESVDGYKRIKDFGDTDPYGLYATIQKVKRRKQYDTIKELSKYSQLVASVDKVNIDRDLEELYKLTIRLQRNDEKCDFLLDKTCGGELIWRRLVQSGIMGSVYIANFDENKYLLRCYKESGNVLYRLYKNAEHIPNSGVTRYLEVVIKGKNPKNATNVNVSAYYPDKVMQSVNKEIVAEPSVLPKKRRVNIGIKDFVVRRNVFKCIHNKHSIEDVDVVVKIMNKNIEIEEVVVLAGYCKQCKVFFILESTYQQLLRKGVVAFRTVDEKRYLSQSYLNGKLLAQESILMQFGYTVSQTEGLSEERRHKILSVLVDNHILTKSEIISYLDFFISQRKSDKFALAVAKWTIDRNYIRNYKIGEYSRIGVVYKNEI